MDVGRLSFIRETIPLACRRAATAPHLAMQLGSFGNTPMMVHARGGILLGNIALSIFLKAR